MHVTADLNGFSLETLNQGKVWTDSHLTGTPSRFEDDAGKDGIVR